MWYVKKTQYVYQRIPALLFLVSRSLKKSIKKLILFDSCIRRYFNGNNNVLNCNKGKTLKFLLLMHYTFLYLLFLSASMMVSGVGPCGAYETMEYRVTNHGSTYYRAQALHCMWETICNWNAGTSCTIESRLLFSK